MNYKGFHHLTWNDRLTIEKMLKVHTAKAKIAEALGVSVRTIYYEIKRGMCTQRNTDYTVEERYCAEVAERAYREPESNNCIRFRFCAFFLKNRIKSKPLDVSRGFDDTTLKNFTTIFAIYS